MAKPRKLRQANIKRNKLFKVIFFVISILFIIIITSVLVYYHIKNSKNTPSPPKKLQPTPTTKNIPKLEDLSPLDIDKDHNIIYKASFELAHNNTELQYTHPQVNTLSKSLNDVYKLNNNEEMAQLSIGEDNLGYRKAQKDLFDMILNKHQQTFDLFTTIWTKTNPLLNIKMLYSGGGNKSDKIELPPYYIIAFRIYYLYTELLSTLMLNYIVKIKELKYRMFYTYAIFLIRVFNGNLEFLTDNKEIKQKEFDEWQDSIDNRIKIFFLSKKTRLLKGLPLFLVFLFLREENILKMHKNKEFYIEPGKINELDCLIKQLNDIKDYDEEIIDNFIGKCYKLFSLIKMRHEKGYNEAIDKFIIIFLDDLNTSFNKFLSESRINK